MPLSQIRIVLVNTTDPGNIGATARAMKTMGLKQLYLVEPKSFPHVNASVRASNAIDVLAEVMVVDYLATALQDCHLVFGASTRIRELNWVSLTPRVAAEKIVINNPKQKVAVVFGRERCGLSNKELQQCHFQINIPANPDYSSLNLAAAVQIVCYELRMAFLHETKLEEKSIQLADVREQEYFYRHLQDLLNKIEFLKPIRSQQIMDRLRRLFSRSELDINEVKILRGILSTIEKKLASKP